MLEILKPKCHNQMDMQMECNCTKGAFNKTLNDTTNICNCTQMMM